MKELENMVTSIRDELNRLYEDDYTDEQRDEMEENGEAYDLYSYFADALDIEYTVDSRLNYRSARIAVTLGGPNIYVDTAEKSVVGYWGSDTAESPLPWELSDAIDDIMADYYDAARG